MVLDFSEHADGDAEVEDDVGDNLQRKDKHFLVEHVFQKDGEGSHAHSEEHAQHVKAEANPSMDHDEAEGRVSRLLNSF